MIWALCRHAEQIRVAELDALRKQQIEAMAALAEKRGRPLMKLQQRLSVDSLDWARAQVRSLHCA